jgi:hypothetical protein
MHRTTLQTAEQNVENARALGLAECRKGMFHRGCFSNTSPAGRQFAEAYETWMRLRAERKDKFALSLGYGSEGQP